MILNKRIALLGLLLGWASCQAQDSMALDLDEFTPQNTVFVFDIHDVVTKFAIDKIWPAYCKLHNKTKFVDSVFKYLFKNKKKRIAIEGEVLANDPKNETSIALLNPHTPNKQTCEIITKLHSAGYQIYGCSNIGEKSYKYMQDLYPKVFGLFKDCYTSCAASGYMKKNNPIFFTQTINMIEAKAGFTPKYFIFIDNSYENLELAKKADARFTGILFKDAQQLERTLNSLGIY